MSFANRLTELRKKRGWNQKELSEHSKVSQATISRIENGEVKEVRGEALRRLAGALETSVDYLIGKSISERPDGVMIHDEQARYLFRGYEGLSDGNQKTLIEFFEFLQQKEKEKGKEVKKIVES